MNTGKRASAPISWAAFTGRDPGAASQAVSARQPPSTPSQIAVASVYGRRVSGATSQASSGGVGAGGEGAPTPGPARRESGGAPDVGPPCPRPQPGARRG